LWNGEPEDRARPRERLVCSAGATGGDDAMSAIEDVFRFVAIRDPQRDARPGSCELLPMTPLPPADFTLL
jgi:hypothetical protein